MRHVLITQLLALVLAAMVEDDIDGGEPALELVHPVGEGGEGPHHHEGPIDLLPPQMTQEAYGLHLHANTNLISTLT